jgi:hypothetical protein
MAFSNMTGRRTSHEGKQAYWNAPNLYKEVMDTEESLMAALSHLIDNKSQVLALSAWYRHTGSSGNQDLRGQVLLQSVDMWVGAW